jgi:ABC-type molybdenum transport system ATPase subunit/photorepair protein PhrA
LRRAEITTIIGPNGAGKTTLTNNRTHTRFADWLPATKSLCQYANAT